MKFSEAVQGDKFTIVAHDLILTKVPYMTQTCCTPEHNATFVSGEEVKRVKINDDAQITIVESAPPLALSLPDDIMVEGQANMVPIVETTETPPNTTGQEIIRTKYRGGKFKRPDQK